MLAFLLTLAGAALAVGLELLEALAIVLAVGVSRSFRDAVLGALAAGAVLAVLAVLLGPVLVSGLPLEPLRVTIGALLLLFGLEWLRKAVLRLAGRRSPSSSFREFLEERAALEELELPAPGRPDWAARVVSFKGVLLEGVEVILIVTALAARPGGAGPAIIGAGAALLAVVAVGAALRAPLAGIPETELKYGVGLVLSTFGVFFAAEGMGVEWPGGDAALVYLLAALLAVSRLQVAWLARGRLLEAGA